MSATIPCGTERFPRQRSDARHTDWEKSAPAKLSWGKEALSIAGFVLFLMAVIWGVR